MEPKILPDWQKCANCSTEFDMEYQNELYPWFSSDRRHACCSENCVMDHEIENDFEYIIDEDLKYTVMVFEGKRLRERKHFKTKEEAAEFAATKQNAQILKI